MRKWKAYTAGELKLVNDTKLTTRAIARMTGRSMQSIYSKRNKLLVNKASNPVTTVKTPTVNNNSTIKEININGIKILIDGAKLNITI